MTVGYDSVLWVLVTVRCDSVVWGVGDSWV